MDQNGAGPSFLCPLAGRARWQPVEDDRVVVVVQIGDKNVTGRVPHLYAPDDHFHYAAIGEAVRFVQGVELAPVVEEAGGGLGRFEALTSKNTGQAKWCHDN